MKFILKITVSSCGTVYSDATVLFHPTQRYDFADVINQAGKLRTKAFMMENTKLSVTE